WVRLPPLPLWPPQAEVILLDGVRGVTEARETVNLEAPGSTPAEYPESVLGMCSWESSESPKLADRVRILASLRMVPRPDSRPCSALKSLSSRSLDWPVPQERAAARLHRSSSARDSCPIVPPATRPVARSIRDDP